MTLFIIRCFCLQTSVIKGYRRNQASGSIWEPLITRKSEVVEQESLQCNVGESVSIPLYSPPLTCTNRCLSYTPFGPGHFFSLNHLIVIHFEKASDVGSAWIPSNYPHSNKSPLQFDKASGLSAVSSKLGSLELIHSVCLHD